MPSIRVGTTEVTRSRDKLRVSPFFLVTWEKIDCPGSCARSRDLLGEEEEPSLRSVAQGRTRPRFREDG